jgi:hypothetical protein
MSRTINAGIWGGLLLNLYGFTPNACLFIQNKKLSFFNALGAQKLGFSTLISRKFRRISASNSACTPQGRS